MTVAYELNGCNTYFIILKIEVALAWALKKDDKFLKYSGVFFVQNTDMTER